MNPRFTLSLNDVQTLRDRRYRRLPELALRMAEEAVAFVEEVGFCFFWPIKGVELPSLWEAVAGPRPVAAQHDDPGHITWRWKDELLGQRQWYYGKLLRGKATLVSPSLLPYFYALTENTDDPEDYLYLYQEGHLSTEAKAIYEAILREGPMHVLRLQRETGMTGKKSKSRFERALVELQRQLMILPVGIAEAGAWRYAFVYELLIRHWPEIPTQARHIARNDAWQVLLRRYLDNVIAARPDQVTRLFGWKREEAEKAAIRLVEEGYLLTDVVIEKTAGVYWLAREAPGLTLDREPRDGASA
ncbi:MAG TPA: hypothetical protein EYP04_00495 [Anaerolineae bacterium]|nr:hypothetical protein [Anaerolineae bacterium]HIQ04325.1 hypothetical protein [Anaerolineae bacterium]